MGSGMWISPIMRSLIAMTVAAAMAGEAWADSVAVPSLPPRSSGSFLEANCLDCHTGPDAELGLDLDALSGPVNDEKLRRWVQVHDRVAAGEMPPADHPQPPAADRAATLRDLAAALEQADRRRSDVVLRRLNRAEYENTLRDLFGTDAIRIKEMLPIDNSLAGFDNVGEGLGVSAEAVQIYVVAADAALDAVFGPANAPKRIELTTNLNDQRNHRDEVQVATQYHRVTPDGLLVFNSYNSPTNIVNFSRLKPVAGSYRVRIKARTVQGTEPLVMRVEGGDTVVGRREKHLVGFYEVPAGEEWTTIEFTDLLVEDGGTWKPTPFGTVDTRTPETCQAPGIEFGEITIEGPLEEWPPASRGQLLGEVDPATGTLADIKEILARILPRAFRRPVAAEEQEPYVTLAEQALEAGRPFEEALRVALTGVLCAPEFLYLDEPSRAEAAAELERVGQHALACRLSYFLWSSMPDAELIRLADAGRLDDPAELRRQVERLLADPKARALTDNFAGQWLRLREIDFTEPDNGLYPDYDEMLRYAMLQESRRFFEHVLAHDLGVINFVDSDFTFLNERLAAHYGIPGVKGVEMRRVPLPAESVRGGLMTQAAVLKVTANGTNTSPVLRGIWVLENLLGQHVSPPPANVPAVEPDIRGASTLRELLVKHRDVEGCNACHRKIDPAGLALESFDVIGGWRENYRTSNDGVGERPRVKQDPFTHAWITYRIGLPVDPSGELADGRDFRDIRELKQLLVADQKALAHGLAEKLAIYGLGRRMGFSDRGELAAIVERAAPGGYGFRELIHQLVQSDLFRRP